MLNKRSEGTNDTHRSAIKKSPTLPIYLSLAVSLFAPLSRATNSSTIPTAALAPAQEEPKASSVNSIEVTRERVQQAARERFMRDLRSHPPKARAFRTWLRSKEEFKKGFETNSDEFPNEQRLPFLPFLGPVNASPWLTVTRLNRQAMGIYKEFQRELEYEKKLESNGYAESFMLDLVDKIPDKSLPRVKLAKLGVKKLYNAEEVRIQRIQDEINDYKSDRLSDAEIGELEAALITLQENPSEYREILAPFVSPKRGGFSVNPLAEPDSLLNDPQIASAVQLKLTEALVFEFHTLLGELDDMSFRIRNASPGAALDQLQARMVELEARKRSEEEALTRRLDETSAKLNDLNAGAKEDKSTKTKPADEIGDKELTFKQKVEVFNNYGQAAATLISLKNPEAASKISSLVNLTSSVALAYGTRNPVAISSAALALTQTISVFASKNNQIDPMQLIGESLNALHSKLDFALSQIEAIQKQIADGFEQVNERFDEIQESLDQIVQISLRISGEINSVQTQIEDVSWELSSRLEEVNYSESAFSGADLLHLRLEIEKWQELLRLQASIDPQLPRIAVSREVLENIVSSAILGSLHPHNTFSNYPLVGNDGQPLLFRNVIERAGWHHSQPLPTGILFRASEDLYDPLLVPLPSTVLPDYQVGTRQIAGQEEGPFLEGIGLYLALAAESQVPIEVVNAHLAIFAASAERIRDLYSHLSKPEMLHASLAYWEDEAVGYQSAVSATLSDERITKPLGVMGLDLSKRLSQFELDSALPHVGYDTHKLERKKAATIEGQAEVVNNESKGSQWIRVVDARAPKTLPAKYLGQSAPSIKVEAKVNEKLLSALNRHSRAIFAMGRLDTETGEKEQKLAAQKLRYDTSFEIELPKLTSWDLAKPWGNPDGASEYSRRVKREIDKTTYTETQNWTFQFAARTLPIYRFNVKVGANPAVKLTVKSEVPQVGWKDGTSENGDLNEYLFQEVWRAEQVVTFERDSVQPDNKPRQVGEYYNLLERVFQGNTSIDGPNVVDKWAPQENWKNHRRESTENIVFAALDYVRSLQTRRSADSGDQYRDLTSLRVRCEHGLVQEVVFGFASGAELQVDDVTNFNNTLRVIADSNGVSSSKPPISGVSEIELQWLVPEGKIDEFFESHDKFLVARQMEALPILQEAHSWPGHPVWIASQRLDQAASLYRSHGHIAAIAMARQALREAKEPPILKANEPSNPDAEIWLMQVSREVDRYREFFEIPSSRDLSAALRLASITNESDPGQSISRGAIDPLINDVELALSQQGERIEEWEAFLKDHPMPTFGSIALQQIIDPIESE